MVRSRLGVALLVVAGFVFAGCAKPAAPSVAPSASAKTNASAIPGASADTAGSPRPSGSGGPETADPCLLVKQPIAAEFVGTAVQLPQLSDRGDALVCVYAAHDGGPGTLGVTIFNAVATSRSLPALASAAPDARPVAGLDDALVATGAAWIVSDGHVVSLVLVHPDGALATVVEMRDLVRAIRTAVAAGS